MNIQKRPICAAQLFSWSDWRDCPGINRIAYNASLLLNSRRSDLPIRHNNIAKKRSGSFDKRAARLFMFYQFSIRFFSYWKPHFEVRLTSLYFHHLIFTDRRKFIMWEPIFLGQSFFTSFPISLTTFSSSCCNFLTYHYFCFSSL